MVFLNVNFLINVSLTAGQTNITHYITQNIKFKVLFLNFFRAKFNQ